MNQCEKEKGNGILLSVCIPSFNKKDYLRESLEKLLAYEGDDLQVVVIDNASTDGTWEMLQEFHDKRLHICKHERNYGARYNNACATYSGTGKYHVQLNDRDHYETGELREYLEFLRNTDYDVVLNLINERYLLPLNNMVDRTYAMLRYGHAGEKSIRRELYDRSLRPEEDVLDFKYGTDIFLAENWGYYPGGRMVHEPENLAEVAQTRTEKNGSKAYFTPEGMLASVRRMIIQSEMPQDRVEEYYEGIIKWVAINLMAGYHEAIVNYEVHTKRYADFYPPKRVNYRKMQRDFFVSLCESFPKWTGAELSENLKDKYWKYSKTGYKKLMLSRIKAAAKKMMPDHTYKKLVDISSKQGVGRF